MKKRTRIAIFVTAGALLLAGVFAAWLLGTESGLRFALARAVGATDGRLSLRDARGSLWSGFELDGVTWRDRRAGADLLVERARIVLDAGELFARVVHIRTLDARGIRAALTTVPPDPDAKPFDLAAPLTISIDDGVIASAIVTQDGEPLLELDELRAAASWDTEGIAVQRLALRSPQGRVDLDGALLLRKGWNGGGKLRFAWRDEAREWTGLVTARSDGKRANLDIGLAAPTDARIVLNLEPRGKWPWAASVRVPAFPPQRVLPESTWQSLALALDGSGDESGGRFSGELAIDARRFTLEDVRYTLGDQSIEVTALRAGSPDLPGAVEGRASLVRDEGPLRGTAALTWRDVVLPADIAGQELATQGEVALEGSTDAWHADAKFTLGPLGAPNEIVTQVDGTPDELRFTTFTVRQPAGALEGSGTLALGDVPRWNVDAKAAHVDPGVLFAEWPGALDFTFHSAGEWREEGASGTVKLDGLGGMLRGRAIAGEADLQIAPGWEVAGRAQLRAGASTATLEGAPGDATLVLRVATLADFVPDASGRVDATLRAQGRWPDLALNGSGEVSELEWDGASIERARVTLAMKDLEPIAGEAHLRATGFARGDVRWESLAIDFSGDEAAHELALDARGEPASVALVLRGGGEGESWRGTLDTLRVAPAEGEAFVLERATSLEYTDGALGIGDACLAADAARICLASRFAEDGAAEASYRVERVPLALVARYAALDAEVEIEGMLDGNGRFTRATDGTLAGDAVLVATPGRVRWPGGGEAALVAWSELRFDARRAADGIHAELNATLDDGGRVVANADVTGPDDALAGNIDATLGNVAFLELLTPELVGARGRLTARYALGGTLSQPRLDGALTLEEFAAELPTLGIRVDEGSLRATATDADRYSVTGSLRFGEGVLAIEGEGGVGAGSEARIALRGESLLLADVPGLRIVATPDLTLERNEKRVLLGGKLTIPSGRIDLERLPGGQTSRESSDVIVLDAGAVEQSRGDLPFAADVVLVLGKEVKVKGYGLDGKVEGQLRVRERPSRPTTGTGELRVSGKYKAYGQNLTIDRGRLLFAESPLEDPGLDMVATRPLRDVTPGLRITGRAQAPVLTVFATPAMEQAEALSYLVTGRPLRGLSNEEGSTVTMAAQALGAITGDLLAKGIGKRIGVDDIGVSTDDRIGGSAFTIGKYLSPRLYLSYGIGLFTPGEIVTLRYELTQHWNFEASTGSVENRAGVNYKIER